jgi:DNA-binding IclR family transcriptional regulator
MYIRIPLWIKVMRALHERSHNTYTISQQFKCNKNTASIVLNRLVRTGYAKRDQYNWFSPVKIRIKRMDSDQTNGNQI